jgi:hypothetical protein
MRALVTTVVLLGACRAGFDENARRDAIAGDIDGGPILTSRLQTIASNVDYSTTNSSFVDVPGARLTITPDSPEQPWVVLAYAAFSSLSTAEVAAEVRFTIDGVERALGGAQLIASDDIASFMAFDILTDGAPHTIQLQLRDATATGSRVTDYRIVAFSLPTDAVFWVADDPSQRDVTLTTFATFLTLDVLTPGEYLVLGGASATEFPGASNVALRVVDPAAAQWPVLDYFNHRADWYAFLWARKVTLSAPGTFSLDARGNAPASLRNMRLAAIRVDAFETVESSLSAASQQTMSTTPVVMTTLTTQPPPDISDYVVLQHLGMEINVTGGKNGAVFRLDGMDRGSYVRDTESPGNTAGIVDVIGTALPMVLDNTCFANPGTVTTYCYESVIHALRLKSP